MTNRFDAVFASTAKADLNSDFALALVPAPEQARVSLRAGYLSNTGWRPSDAIRQAVTEWRKGYLYAW